MDVSLFVCFLIGRVPVPYIALIDGLTMGGVSDNVIFVLVLIYLRHCIDF